MPTDRPKSIQQAVIYLWISTGLAAAMTLLQMVGVIATESVAMTSVIGAISVALLALVAAKVGAGRGWARWLFVVLYVVGSLVGVIAMVLAPQIFLALPLLSQGSAVVQFLLQTMALVLMFTKTSRNWFKSARAMQVRSNSLPTVRAPDAASSPRSSPKPEDRRLIWRLVQNVDLPLLLLSPAVSAFGLVSGPPLAAWLLYLGIIGFVAALVMNHRKHMRARKLS